MTAGEQWEPLSQRLVVANSAFAFRLPPGGMVYSATRGHQSHGKEECLHCPGRKIGSLIVFLVLSAAAVIAGFAGVLGGQARGHVT